MNITNTSGKKNTLDLRDYEQNKICIYVLIEIYICSYSNK